MNITEIREVSIDSAEKYYQYLERNDKGLQEVEVYEITRFNDDSYRLRLSAKLFDIEAISFRVYSTNRSYNTGEIKVIEYDSDKNTLLVKPGEDILSIFARLHPRDIKVISDLKFLVERIKKWYEIKGAEIVFPENCSTLKNSFTNIRYLPGLEPSINQKSALSLIFNTPFSYIWGAPGTGKTQFVLSYAVLHYLEHNKKVIILAPTNNAIEQVLKGVLQMTDKAGVHRSKILRIGVPSKRFAEDYPEVCEERGIMKKLDELNKQIDIYSKLLTLVTAYDQLENARKQLAIFSTFGSFEAEIYEIKEGVKKSEEEYISSRSQWEQFVAKTGSIVAREMALHKKIKSLSYKISRLFSNRQAETKLELQDIGKELIESRTREEYWQSECKEKEIALKERKRELSVAENKLKKLVSDIKTMFSFTDGLRSVVSTLNDKNRESVHIAIQKQLVAEQVKLQEQGGVLQEYKSHSPGDLQSKIEKLNLSKSKMAAASTEERLKGVNVVACTLDGYVGRFTDTRLEVDHAFMDEAGYSNIIKALTLFNIKSPVTFLGDHMQLPPVCEINDTEMQRNPEYSNTFLWAQSAIFLEHIFSKSMQVLLKEYLDNIPMQADRMKQANLIHTYRFGKNLASILDSHVYGNGFASSRQNEQTMIYYMHASKSEPLKSRISTNEVHAIRNIVESFQPGEDFVILTPYKNQVYSLGKSLPKEKNELKILTVHGSQGREWDTVILSIVDTSDKWFVDSKQTLSNGLNLLNTAISRTKKRLIIVCDFRYWQNQEGQLVSDLLAEAKEMKH